MFNNRSNNNDRIQQKQTIHEMVEKSVATNFNAAEKTTGKNTHHNEHRKIEGWMTEDPSATTEQISENENPESDNAENTNFNI